MEDRGLYLRVGAFIALGVALLCAAVFILTSARWERGLFYETYFQESVQGLDVGAPVKFRGVTVGRVTDIGLVAAEYGATAYDQISDAYYRQVVVRFKVEPRRIGNVPDTADAVAHGLRVKLANQGLTGVMYLEVDFVTPAAGALPKLPWEPRNDYIPSVPSTIAEVGSAVTRLLQNAQRIDLDGLSARAEKLLDSLNGELADKGAAQAVLVQAADTLRAMQTALEQANLPALSAQFRETGAAFTALAQGPRTRALLARLDEAVAKLPALIAQLQAVGRHADNGLADVEARADPLLRDAAAAVQNLRETTEDLRRDPAALLFGAPPPRSRK